MPHKISSWLFPSRPGSQTICASHFTFPDISLPLGVGAASVAIVLCSWMGTDLRLEDIASAHHLPQYELKKNSAGLKEKKKSLWFLVKRTGTYSRTKLCLCVCIFANFVDCCAVRRAGLAAHPPCHGCPAWKQKLKETDLLKHCFRINGKEHIVSERAVLSSRLDIASLREHGKLSRREMSVAFGFSYVKWSRDPKHIAYAVYHKPRHPRHTLVCS